MKRHAIGSVRGTLARRSFFGVAAGAAAGSMLLGQESAPSNGVDFVLSIVRKQGDVVTDLGGVFRENVGVDELVTGTCCGGSATNVLAWKTPGMLSDPRGAVDLTTTNIQDQAAPVTVMIPVLGDSSGQSLRLSGIQLFEGDSATPTRELNFGTPVQIVFDANPQVINQEIQADDGTYQVFGVACRRPAENTLTATLKRVRAAKALAATTPQPQSGSCGSYWFENIVNLGYYSIPNTQTQWLLHGPDYHPLDVRCRPKCTWHMNFLLKRKSDKNEFANNHYGAYYENGQFCLIYWDNIRNYCNISCNRNLPSWSQVYNWTSQVVDRTFRELYIVLPYLVLAGIAVALTSAFFSSLAGVAFAV